METRKNTMKMMLMRLLRLKRCWLEPAMTTSKMTINNHFPRLFGPKISDGGDEDPYLSDSAVGEWSTAGEWVYTIDMQGPLAKFSELSAKKAQKKKEARAEEHRKFWADKKDHGLEDIQDRLQRFSDEVSSRIPEGDKASGILESFSDEMIEEMEKFLKDFDLSFLNSHAYYNEARHAPSSTTSSKLLELDAEVDRILRDKNFTCKLEFYQDSAPICSFASTQSQYAISRSRLRPSTNPCVTRLKLRSDSIDCPPLLFQHQANPNSSKSDIIPRSSLPSNKAYQQRPQPASEMVEGPGVPPPLVRLEHHTITVTRIKATMTSGQPPKPCHEVPSKDGERLKKRLKSYFETVWKFRKDSVDIKFDENIIEYDLGDVEADFVFEYSLIEWSGSRAQQFSLGSDPEFRPTLRNLWNEHLAILPHLLPNTTDAKGQTILRCDHPAINSQAQTQIRNYRSKIGQRGLQAVIGYLQANAKDAEAEKQLVVQLRHKDSFIYEKRLNAMGLGAFVGQSSHNDQSKAGGQTRNILLVVPFYASQADADSN
ncbi:hypothetical protein GGU11DRAFT_879885 [Lentinula aff. detonsa]|nr:hypothetical protein GGU11DRAFT_879885 [Lentinula aff. detonsa]